MRYVLLLLCLPITLAGVWLVQPAARGNPGTPNPSRIGLPFPAERARSLQLEWAKALRLEPEISNSVGMKLVLILGGRFDMGPNGSKYRVTLAKPKTV